MRVYHRCKFIQPRRFGPLNLMGLILRSIITVEIYPSRGGFALREADTKERRPFTALQQENTVEQAKKSAVAAFEEQPGNWTLHDENGNLLDPNDLLFGDNGKITRKPDTHLPPHMREVGSDQKTIRAACGVRVDMGQITTLRPPTCGQCRIIAEQDKKRAGGIASGTVQELRP